MIRRSLICLATAMLMAACATADGTGDTVDSGVILGPDANPFAPDANPQGTPDAPPVQGNPDAPPISNPVPITLTHSTSQNIVSLNSVACSNNTTGFTRENHYYRVFNLATFGVTSALTVTDVDVGIETAVGFSGSQAATLVLHTLTGVIDAGGTLSPVATQPLTVANQDLTILNTAISGTIPAGATLVVEFWFPDGDLDLINGNTLYIGSNNLGEGSPSYISAPDCPGTTTPVTAASIGFPDMQIVMNVNGTHIP